MKRAVGDLALFGGRSAFLQPVYVGRPHHIDRARLFDRMNWALDNQWLTNGGPLALEFEDRVAEIAGVRSCVSTCNATTGLQLLFHAAEVTGEVIMPSLTFAATAHAARWIGLEPVFVDVDPLTGGVDPDEVAARIGHDTGAIVGVHLWGRPCAVDELEKLAAEHGLPLFFDAAHAIGCSHAGRPVGGFGTAEVFSFHATKVVNGFEGGAIVSDDDELLRRVRALHNFGIGLPEGHPAGGTNGKMSEASAAMALTSLDSFPAAVRHNHDNFAFYRAELADLPGITVVPHEPGEAHNYQYVVVLVDEERTGIGRDLLMRVLRAENAMAKPYFSPACHELEPYRSRRSVRLPHSERLAARALALPTGSVVSREDIRRICNVIRLAVTHGHEVSARRQKGAGA
ncbi:dTDP-4-dehydro-6-deoxyglucose aminotransferase [Streptomyces sp. NPDC006235]|uniref:dTDP-4-dehydro-6-deoxyglucose aminotransferase n=1 Tax=Streptomyces sp. NPDC006235 TaxID=3156736 RepID=UPI0033AAC914